MKVLECSSRGDKRFSAFYAKVSVFGRYDSIENHYQKAKRLKNGDIAGKGKKPDKLIINNKEYDIKYLTPFYNMLWIKYLDQNQDLVTFAEEYEDFNDMFKGRSINCQANSIRQYVKEGRESFFKDEVFKEFLKELRHV